MFYINNSLNTETRYDMIKFLDFDYDNIDCLTSYFFYNISILPQLGSYTISNEEKRPDLLSYNIYNDTQYWWVIMIYNSLLSVNDLKAGLTISYPSISSIESLYMNASSYAKSL